jgi:hypothetical protein
MAHQSLHSVPSALNRSTLFVVIACSLAALAYAPALNNGFIADDYAILQRIEFLKTQPLYLFQVPPENFRFVSYAIFGALKAVAGYHAWPFYAFNIGLHLTNIVLFARLLRKLLDDELTVGLAVLFFAVFQAPQEAVMWLAAMNETTLFFFTIMTLLCWSEKRYGLACLSYAVALLCKESGVLVPLLVVLLDFCQKKPLNWRRYAWLALPTAAFAAVFLATLSHNFMLTNRSYSLGFQGIYVLGKSIHRLLWPWMYVIILFVAVKTRQWPSFRRIAAYLAGVIVTMLPYMFIAYQTSLPSRQLYLASAVLATMFAVSLKPISGTSLLKLVVGVFVAFNIGYLWVRKDRQFEERAAPTTQLVQILEQQRPQRTIVKNFAYPFPEIMRGAALAAPGWSPDLLLTDQQEAECGVCLRLTWNAETQLYEAAGPH